LRERLDPLIRRTSALDITIKKLKATWVDPKVDAEVEYGALTDDGLLREAVFKGFRDDLAVRKVKAPRLVPSVGRPKLGVPRENILQLLPEAVAPSKEELADYWARVWQKALPHLGHRPLKLVRHVHGTTFYHKGPLPKDIPAAVHQLRIQKREGGQGTRLWVDSLDGFLGLVEIGAVELHPWNATVEDFEHADRIVIDLDPGEGVDWNAVVETALDLRTLMKREGYDTWPQAHGSHRASSTCERRRRARPRWCQPLRHALVLPCRGLPVPWRLPALGAAAPWLLRPLPSATRVRAASRFVRTRAPPRRAAFSPVLRPAPFFDFGRDFCGLPPTSLPVRSGRAACSVKGPLDPTRALRTTPGFAIAAATTSGWSLSFATP
jgi:hypothetical protein